MNNNYNFNIFIVEDDLFYSSMLEYAVGNKENYKVKKYSNATDFLEDLHEKPDVVTLDYSLPDMQGDEVLRSIKEVSPDTKVIIISSQEDVKVAVNLLKKGAYDYIVKDEDAKDRLFNTLQILRENAALKHELETLRNQVSSKYVEFKNIVGASPAMQHVLSLVKKAVVTNITVSINGETGTGKELIAKSIHYQGPRNKRPFIILNLSGLSADSQEAELFGYEKDAFDGATGRQYGKIEEAIKSTLYIEDIDSLDPKLQVKFLRFLTDKEIKRLGSKEVIKADVRIIVSSKNNLLEEVKKGRFREDLYYRLIGLPLQLPPLRQRENDMIILAKYFIDNFCNDNGLPRKKLTDGACQKLIQHQFAGNVQELKSVIELSCVMAEGNVISPENINIIAPAGLGSLPKDMTLKEITIKVMQYHLDRYNYDVMKVARHLDIGKSTVYRMIQNKELATPKTMHFNPLAEENTKEE